MRPTPGGGYVGGDAEENLVKLNSDFEFVWAVGSFSGVLTDIAVDAVSGTITAVYMLDDQCHITQLDNSGETLKRVIYNFNGPLNDADIEWTSVGFAFAFNSDLTIGAAQPSVILATTNADLELTWTKSFETPLNYQLMELDLETYNDSIAVLATSTYSDTNYVQFCRVGADGTYYGGTNIGTDCGYYRDFEHLPDGGFVLVGEMKMDTNEEEMLKVSVLDENGLVLATKEQSTSSSDLGWNRASVSVLSDGRYVVCNNYYEGHGGFNQGAFVYFDHHKPVGIWEFHPVAAIEDRDRLALWCVDMNDKLIFSGTVFDEEDGVFVNETMGRITWKSEACDLGFYTGATFDYKIEPSQEIVIELNEIDPIVITELSDDLVPMTYTSTLYCSNPATDPGPEVVDNHIYGDTIPNCYTDPVVIDDAGLKENIFNFSVYPNPTNGDVTIESASVSIIRIFNSQGKLIFTVDHNDTKTTLNLGEISGFYSIQLIDQDGRTQLTRVIRI